MPFLKDEDLFQGTSSNRASTSVWSFALEDEGGASVFIRDEDLFSVEEDGPDYVVAKRGEWRPPTKKRMEALRTRYEPLARAAASRHGVDEDLFVALIAQESKFDPGATSRVGAGGLGQVMPATAKGLGLSLEDLHDPEKNLDAAARYLAQMYKRFNGNVEHTLAAYNAGPGNVRKYKGVPPFEETRTYVRNITKKYQEYKKSKEKQ